MFWLLKGVDTGVWGGLKRPSTETIINQPSLFISIKYIHYLLLLILIQTMKDSKQTQKPFNGKHKSHSMATVPNKAHYHSKISRVVLHLWKILLMKLEDCQYKKISTYSRMGTIKCNQWFVHKAFKGVKMS